MQITALKAQVKNPDRVSVYVDGKFVCGLSLTQVADLGLKNGLELDQAELKKLKKQSDMGKYHMRAVEWLMRRPRSRRELNDYLFKKRLDDEEKQYVVERVERYLDDEAFARFWIDGRRSSKHKSARVIRGELALKGVDKEIVERLLSEHEITDQDTLKAVIAKKQKQSRYKDEQKLIEYLARQGYSYDDIKNVLT